MKKKKNLNKIKKQQQIENKSQTIPIILKKLDVKFYPEGGDLICGLQNVIYFGKFFLSFFFNLFYFTFSESFTAYGDAADFVGQIIDSKNIPQATIQTIHEGRGKGKKENKNLFIFFY